jgi:hydroxyacylglutathione hydrolase
MPGGSQEQEMSSILERLLALPDDTVVLPGHMSETKIGIERDTNPFIREELARRRTS